MTSRKLTVVHTLFYYPSGELMNALVFCIVTCTVHRVSGADGDLPVV